jgi:hypothetical protein
MRFRGIVAVLTVLSCAAATPAVAQSAGALNATEAEAFAFRRLQSELMVAALSCRDSRHHTHYNTFVKRFRPALKTNARVLKAYFTRLHGPMATRKLDDYITHLANEASLASMGDANFCANALRRFEAINHIDADQTAGMIVQEADLFLPQ